MGARVFHHGKQRVSPFYRVSQLFHEKKVFRIPENAVLLFEGKQRVSPLYHDLGLELVGSIGNFSIVAQLLLLVVDKLLNPILSSSHVSRKSSEAAEVTYICSLVCDFSSSHPNNFRDTTSWRCFVKNDGVRSCLIELQPFLDSKIDVDPKHCVLMSLPCFMHVLCIHVDRIRILMVPWDPQARKSGSFTKRSRIPLKRLLMHLFLKIMDLMIFFLFWSFPISKAMRSSILNDIFWN